jgi:hypothetical protein
VIVFLMPLEYWLRAFETRRAEGLVAVTQDRRQNLIRGSLQNTCGS